MEYYAWFQHAIIILLVYPKLEKYFSIFEKYFLQLRVTFFAI